jgi:hypothetical protein
MEQSIFTAKGTIRADLDKMEVSEDRRPALDALQAAQLMCEQTEAEFKAAEAAVTATVRHRNDIAAKVPRGSFMDEWRASVAHSDKRGR